MKIIIAFINKLKMLILHDKAIEEVSSINIHRIYILSLVMVPVHLAHILIFWLNNTGGEDYVYRWRIGIILAHSAMLVIVFVVGVISYRLERQKRAEGRFAHVIQAVASLSYLIFGAIVCSIDQLVTPTINPYLMACTGIAVALLIRPALAVINYAIAYALLYHAVSLTQQNMELLLSVRVNGITATGIGLGVALLLWRNTGVTICQKMQIRDQNRKLEEKNKQLEDFLAIMSHEIRTPLNGVVGMIDLLLETRLDDKQREYAATAQEASELLITLINDILDFSKIEEGKMELEIVNFDLPSTERSILAMVEPKARHKGLVLSSFLDPDIPNILRGDPVRLRQVLLNLLSNAVKFTEKGVVILRTFPEGGDFNHISVRFEVQDTGIGIAGEAAKNLFRPFIQADLSTARKYGGTGLGLSICKRLVELMNGQIGYESKEGRGSTFWFTVPLALGSTEDPAESEYPAPQRPSLSKWKNDPGTILVAEDFAANQKLILIQLEKLGLAAEVVSNGREAIEAFSRKRYALVLMDCQMPVMDGFEAAGVIRNMECALGRRTPIIAATAGAMTRDREKCLKAGMDDCLCKPIRIEDLQKVLSRWLPDTDVPPEERPESSPAVDPGFLAFTGAVAAEESPCEQESTGPGIPADPEAAPGGEAIVAAGDHRAGMFIPAQLNPHFIFNALNTVSFFCEAEPVLASKLLDEFSNYLRRSIDFSGRNGFIELEQEISLVKSYLTLENARYGEKLKVVYRLDENAFSHKVPPLILQPIVENAVKHGILPRENGGTVMITARLDNNQLILSVEDDGLGMRPGAAAAAPLIEGPQGNGGAGLKKIQKRISALYGRSIEIKSEKGKGTCVTVVIPAQRGEDDDTGSYRGR